MCSCALLSILAWILGTGPRLIDFKLDLAAAYDGDTATKWPALLLYPPDHTFLLPNAKPPLVPLAASNQRQPNCEYHKLFINEVAWCCLCPGLLDAPPYLPLGVGGEVVQSQTHRLWEQVRKAAASSSQHSCCKLLLYPLPMAHCSEENIFSKQQFKIACHCLHQQPSVSHSPQLGLCGPWCVHRGGPAIPAT